MPVNRLPTRPDIIQTFLVCVFVVHAWAFISFLSKFPAYILRFEPWEILGILAYSQTFALLESALTLGMLLLLSILLPGNFLKEKFVPQASILVISTAAWSAMYAWYTWHYLELSFSKWGFQAGFVISYFLTISVLSYLIRRLPRLEASLYAFADRLTVLSTFYLVIGVLSLFVVTLRNLI